MEWIVGYIFSVFINKYDIINLGFVIYFLFMWKCLCRKKNNLKFYEGYYIIKVFVVNGGIIMGNIVFLYFLFL